MIEQQVNFLDFANAEQQSEYLALQVARILQQSIDLNGTASLAVSGGSTPQQMFEHLSKADIDWANVTITLVDDRWVDSQHCASNQQLVEEHLLQNLAANARFIALYQPGLTAEQASPMINQQLSQVATPFDIVLLGMGNDGHTASLFPCCEQISTGFTTTDLYLATQPSSAPHTRMSLSVSAISQAKHRFLQLKGNDKKATLEKALQEENEQRMPIKRFLTKDITVLWCP